MSQHPRSTNYGTTRMQQSASPRALTINSECPIHGTHVIKYCSMGREPGKRNTVENVVAHRNAIVQKAIEELRQRAPIAGFNDGGQQSENGASGSKSENGARSPQEET